MKFVDFAFSFPLRFVLLRLAVFETGATFRLFGGGTSTSKSSIVSEATLGDRSLMQKMSDFEASE
jgi:hypothetical protein